MKKSFVYMICMVALAGAQASFADEFSDRTKDLKDASIVGTGALTYAYGHHHRPVVVLERQGGVGAFEPKALESAAGVAARDQRTIEAAYRTLGDNGAGLRIVGKVAPSSVSGMKSAVITLVEKNPNATLLRSVGSLGKGTSILVRGVGAVIAGYGILDFMSSDEPNTAQAGIATNQVKPVVGGSESSSEGSQPKSAASAQNLSE